MTVLAAVAAGLAVAPRPPGAAELDPHDAAGGSDRHLPGPVAGDPCSACSPDSVRRSSSVVRSASAAAPLAAVAAWVALARTEPSAVRREREAAARELPHFVDLFSCALRSGASPQAALSAVVAACPGPTALRLDGALARLRMGVDPVLVWGGVADDDVLATLGRTLARAEASGSSVADAVERLADELERSPWPRSRTGRERSA